MHGYAWHIFTFGVIGIFLIVITFRVFGIIRLPIHLRWELAPVPKEKGRYPYGGSYLEVYEWWNKRQHVSHLAHLQYMAEEVFLLRSIWHHNRALWLFSFSLHMGIYLIVGMFGWLVLNALFMVAGVPQLFEISQNVGSILALGGYLLGTLGALGLFLKRALDPNLKPFNTFSRYFNLLFLNAVFISGGYAWLVLGDSISKMSLLIEDLITFDVSITVGFPLAVHLVISLLFVIYLPMTDMIHFMAKYFTFHEIRWDDAPLTRKMERELSVLLDQPLTWSAPHAKSEGKRRWLDIAAMEMWDEEVS